MRPRGRSAAAPRIADGMARGGGLCQRDRAGGRMPGAGTSGAHSGARVRSECVRAVEAPLHRGSLTGWRAAVAFASVIVLVGGCLVLERPAPIVAHASDLNASAR